MPLVVGVVFSDGFARTYSAIGTERPSKTYICNNIGVFSKSICVFNHVSRSLKRKVPLDSAEYIPCFEFDIHRSRIAYSRLVSYIMKYKNVTFQFLIQFNSMVYSHNTVQYTYNICTSYNTMYK